MSSAGWIFIGLLIISPVYEAAEMKDEVSGTATRFRRSIMNLNDMVKAVTGKGGEDFVPYGNYCGIGGEGQPVDPIDECCQNHDICYDIAKSGVCRDHGDKSIYQLEYKWRVADDETAVCDDEKDQCKMTICICDAIITNCLKSNIDFYDPQHKKEWDLYQIFGGIEALSNSKK